MKINNNDSMYRVPVQRTDLYLVREKKAKKTNLYRTHYEKKNWRSLGRTWSSWIFPRSVLVSQSELVAGWLLCGSTSTTVEDQRPPPPRRCKLLWRMRRWCRRELDATLHVDGICAGAGDQRARSGKRRRRHWGGRDGWEGDVERRKTAAGRPRRPCVRAGVAPVPRRRGEVGLRTVSSGYRESRVAAATCRRRADPGQRRRVDQRRCGGREERLKRYAASMFFPFFNRSDVSHVSWPDAREWTGLLDRIEWAGRKKNLKLCLFIIARGEQIRHG